MPNIIYQELWGTEHIQGEWLDPGVVDSKLPVDPWTLNAGENSQVGGQPRWVWEREKRKTVKKMEKTKEKNKEMNMGDTISLSEKHYSRK